jgi:limonene-1,2-epoxide hydrolase
MKAAALLLLWALLLVACAPQPPDNEGPVRVVEAFVAALEARDASAIIALLEPSDWREEIGPELRSYLGHVTALDMRDARYSVSENAGDSAVVRVVGTLAYTLADGGASGERAVDLRIEVARVDGAWYLRQLQLPQP